MNTVLYPPADGWAHTPEDWAIVQRLGPVARQAWHRECWTPTPDEIDANYMRWLSSRCSRPWWDVPAFWDAFVEYRGRRA